MFFNIGPGDNPIKCFVIKFDPSLSLSYKLGCFRATEKHIYILRNGLAYKNELVNLHQKRLMGSALGNNIFGSLKYKF
jgi:hypothetical protein